MLPLLHATHTLSSVLSSPPKLHKTFVLSAIFDPGVVPACASLDCLTVFAQSVEDGAEILAIMQSAHAGVQDVWRRTPSAFPTSPPATGFRFAVPSSSQLDWSSPGTLIRSQGGQFAVELRPDGDTWF